ncbi:hypothetical protein GGX14DRAFT_592943 [Mycena pura]|uniref:Ricin B lectin domain-containing protein n=1 Tax=Mycena pura TaxID=153505 RepID=A0AAD6UVF0_9AGAR|nr:hypothetical protein GGX14DRAFT_592943 [Mycena pura]
MTGQDQCKESKNPGTCPAYSSIAGTIFNDNAVTTMFGGEGLYWVRNRDPSDRFIDIVKSPYVNGGQRSKMPIGLLSPRLTRPQLWLVEQVQDGESFVFRNYDTGTVLDVKDGSSNDGALIVVASYKYTGEDASTQHWKIIWVNDDKKTPYYRIENRKLQTVIDQTTNVMDGVSYSIVSWKLHGGNQQQWSFERAVFPTMYWIVSVPSDRCLQYSPSSTNVAALDMKAKFPSRNQLWYLEDLVDYDGYVRILHVDYEDRPLAPSGADNKSILAGAASTEVNQRWKITDVDMNGIVSIVSAMKDTVLYAETGREQTYTPKGSTDVDTFNNHYHWRLIPCPIPALFWTAAQGRGSGKFIGQSNGKIIASDGAKGELDYTAQWRYVSQGRDPWFTLHNRQTGNALYNSTGTALAADNGTLSDKYYWALDAAGQDYAITNLSTSRVLAYVKGDIQALTGGPTDVDRQWFVNASLPSVPSFALINGMTGMALAYVPGVTPYSVKTASTFNSFRCHWIFQQIGNDASDRPVFVIINKFSDNVLDHWGGTRIEALNADTKDTHHHWRLVPCHKRYFAFVNVATGKYLYDNGDAPTTGSTSETMTTEDRRCCWTVVSRRDGIYDTTILDEDVMYPQQANHHIVKRAPKKPPKGKGKAKAEPSHIPDNPRISQITNRDMLAVIERLIGQVDFDSITDTSARTLAGTGRAEVLRWGLSVPRASQEGWNRDGWLRIDLQGTYVDQNGARMANVQGQFNTNTIFHVIIPVGVTFGRERIRQAMITSLETATTVMLDNPPNTQAGGSQTQPITTARPPGPGAPPAGQYWADAAIRVAGIGLMSMMLL